MSCVLPEYLSIERPGATRTLSLLVCSLLLTSCASSPAPREPAAAAASSTAFADLAAGHQKFFANVVAVVAAMGGNNPNPGYGAMSTKGCGQPNLILTGPRPLNTQASMKTPQTATVSAACPQLTATKIAQRTASQRTVPSR
jgi:hypothetical protein